MKAETPNSSQGKSRYEAGPEADTPKLPHLAEYAVDAWQRSILYADVMRQRGNQYETHRA